MKNKDYDKSMMNRAMTGLALRVIVAGYIGYLGWKVLSGTLDGSGTMPLWGAWLAFVVFAAAGVAFCVFAIKQYLLIKKAAELPKTNETEESDKAED